MVGNVVELNEGVQDVVVDCDLPINQVITEGGVGVKEKLEMRTESISVEVGHGETFREGISHAKQVLEAFVENTPQSM